MGPLQKAIVLGIGLAFFTVATLPDRTFAKGVDALGRLGTNWLSTAMATRTSQKYQ